MPTHYKVVKKKKWLKYFDIFLGFAQNRDCGYTLEPHYYFIKVGVLWDLHFTNISFYTGSLLSTFCKRFADEK